MSATGFELSSNATQSYSDALAESYKATQAYRVDGLTAKKTDLQNRQTFYNTLNSKLNTLFSQIDKFGSYKEVDSKMKFVKEDGIDDDFKTRSASLSEKDFFTVSAGGTALVGTNSLKTQRLASNDVLVSKRLTLADNFTESEGEKEFNISVNDKDFAVKVNFTGTETNQEAMTKIVNAINSIEDVEVSASLVKDTEITGRISLVSKTTGEDNKITFSENSTTALLGWTSDMFEDPLARTAMQGVSAGYKKADSSQLTAKFEVNGIEITRNKNEVDDVLPGMTIKLLKVQDADAEPINIVTDIDTTGVVNLVDAFVKEYNGLLYFLNNNKTIQRADPGMGTLKNRLRSVVSSRMSESEDADAPKYITDIGFKINNDGTVVMNDKDKLTEYLSKDNGAQNVAELFTSEFGFAAKISETVVSLRPQNGEIGLIKSRNTSITAQLVSLNSRITTVESNINQQAESVRKEYESYLKVYLEAQGQYSLLSTMGSGSSGSYDSLLSSQYSS